MSMGSALLWFCCFGVMASAASAHDIPYIEYAVIDGDLSVETSGSDVTPNTQFAIASVGKTMTAVAVLRLVEQGRIALDERAAEQVSPDVAGLFDGLNDATPRHLLTMTSGLPDYYTADYLDDALENPDEVQTPTVALSYAVDEVPLFEAGDSFDYSNTNYVLLGLIAEYATRQSYAQIMRSQVFGPAGMSDSFVFGSRDLPNAFVTGHSDGDHVRDYFEGQGFGDGGVISTAHDLERFYVALFEDRSLLSSRSLSEILKDPIGAGYGMGVEIEDGIVGHSGGDYGFAADVRMDVEYGDIAITLIGEEDADVSWTFDVLDAE